MKKIFLITLVAIMLLGIRAFAAENPTVKLNGNEIVFADQTAIIKNDRTLVPARGVFEAMGAKVKWHEKERRVQIDSRDNITRVYLTIDSDNMEVYKFKSIFAADREDKTLDVPAQIINDRTMIPLRAVSEAFDCKVEWDGDAREVIITTKEFSEMMANENVKAAKEALLKQGVSEENITYTTIHDWVEYENN